MEEGKTVFKINDSFKTLLKAEIIGIIILMLFIILCVLLLARMHYVTFPGDKQKATRTISTQILGNQEHNTTANHLLIGD